MSSRRILVVDDERIVAQDISECLISMGCDVIGTALAGAEAIEKAATLRPDLIMMDIVIQGEMDGIDAAKIIRENYDIPCVFLTAYSDPGVLSRAKACEPAGYIVKPFEEASLRSTVEIALYKVDMEHALKESHEWLATTLNSIGDGVIATDAGGNIKFMNPIAEKLTGWEGAAAAGRRLDSVFTIYNEETRQPTLNPALRALEDGCVCTLERGTILSRPDGSIIPIDDSGAPIRDNVGNIIGSVLVFRDVTETRKAELEVMRHQEHLEELVEERTHKIQKTNEQLTAEIDVRRRTEQALAYKMGMENLISNVSSLFLNLKPTEIDNSLSAALEKIGTVLGVESCYIVQYTPKGDQFSLTHSWPNTDLSADVQHEFKDVDASAFPWWNLRLTSDDYIFVPNVLAMPQEAAAERELFRKRNVSSILAAPLRDGSRLVGYLGFPSPDAGRQWQSDDLAVLRTLSSILLSAITRKRNEDEKERLQEQLAHSQKMEAVGKLSGGIAHDFNNMLLPIIGYSDMLLTSMEEDDPRTKDLAEIRKAAERAASLTRQLLAFSRKQVISKSVFDLNSAITDMENMLRRIIGEDVQFVTELAEGTAPVRADVGQIEQVLMNLVINARHAMPSGGSILLRAGNFTGSPDELKLIGDKRADAYTYIEVQDNGSGMDADLISRIFEPFYTTKGLDGTGLGLAVVYGIIEQHDGGIDVQSELGKGTTFRILLPAAPAEQAQQARIQNETRARTNFSGHGQRILLVEDEPGVRNFVSEALLKNGYQVMPAGSIREAEKVFAEHGGQFDLIFSDAVLPDGNGINMLESILGSYPDMRALLSSGYTDKHNLMGMLEDYNVEFLQKPYSLPKLIETVGQMLQEEPTLPA